MPVTGVVVILAILALFTLAVILLLHVVARYKYLALKTGSGIEDAPAFLRCVYNEYRSAYERFGEDVNTPAIIDDAMNSKLGGLLLCERYLASAVSLFVTLGLFGTFLGLSLSVQSLTELISMSNSSEWLNILDSVGGGLMSSLSGMGVAFYTSLVGVACSIVLTILRAILNPEALRLKLQTHVELWLDHQVAPTLKTNATKRDSELVNRMIGALEKTAGELEDSLRNASNTLISVSDTCTEQIRGFDGSVNKFNKGIRDFSEVDYNLRGTVERMDLAIRDLSSAMREITRRLEGSGK